MARIRLKPLALLCRRLATATGAGLEDRRIWRDEAERSTGTQRESLTIVSEALSRGEAIGDALKLTGDYLPDLFRRIVGVGDKTGRLDRTYRRLAEHYEHLIAARRSLLGALAWPCLQLTMAIGVVALMIVISSFMNLKDLDGKPLDMLGFGLHGTSGLIVLIGVVLVALLGLVMLLELARRGGPVWRKLLSAASRVPLVGGPFETLALAQFTWALQLVLDTPMDLRQALPLALDATGNDRYGRLGPDVARTVERGATIGEALQATGEFPKDLLDAIAVGEQSGLLSETMERLSKEYQQRSAAAIGLLAQMLGYLVWLAVAALIVMLIFRVFGFYVGTIERLAK